MAITIPELNNVNTLDDTDNIMLTHSNGNSEKISGANVRAAIANVCDNYPTSLQTADGIVNTDNIMITQLGGVNKKLAATNLLSAGGSCIFATGKTFTGPTLRTGASIKVMFSQDITGTDTTTGLTLTYNTDNIAVKVPKDGALEDFCAHDISGTYKYCQAYTTLELIYDGTNFIIVGSPIVISDTNYKIHADGNHAVDVVASDNMNSVTSNAVAGALVDRLRYGSYDANTDRGNVANRSAAILYCLNNIKTNMFTIRYADGYYYMYFVNLGAPDKTVLEINSYNSGALNLYRVNQALTSCSLIKSL